MAKILRPLLITSIFLSMWFLTASVADLLRIIMDPFRLPLEWLESIETARWELLAGLASSAWVGLTLLSDIVWFCVPLIISIILTWAPLETNAAPRQNPC